MAEKIVSSFNKTIRIGKKVQEIEVTGICNKITITNSLKKLIIKGDENVKITRSRKNVRIEDDELTDKSTNAGNGNKIHLGPGVVIDEVVISGKYN